MDPPNAHQDTGKTKPLSPNRNKNCQQKCDYCTSFYSFQPRRFPHEVGELGLPKGGIKQHDKGRMLFNPTPRKVLRGAERLQQLHLRFHSKTQDS